LETNELSKTANGGTELMLRGLHQRLPADLLEKFQIIPSRVRNLELTKKRVLWLHDLPEDPESARVGEEWFRNQFSAIVCVSDWQMQRYNLMKGLPYKESIVLMNAIEPIEVIEKPKDRINFIYHTTPHRGLEILVPVFANLAQQFPNIHLDVYSSFAAYGWHERDVPFKELFATIEAHPNMTYHGFQPNDVIRTALQKAHYFAYPNIWLETSCIALMEAMSAGCVCLHPNFGALPETGGGITRTYQYHEDLNDHARIFHSCIAALLHHKEHERQEYQEIFPMIANYRFNWSKRASQWRGVLENLAAAEQPRLAG
jgi:UDP-glucose:(glucosyl)LPS alpha-1,2-glucosyltransferase